MPMPDPSSRRVLHLTPGRAGLAAALATALSFPFQVQAEEPTREQLIGALEQIMTCAEEEVSHLRLLCFEGYAALYRWQFRDLSSDGIVAIDAASDEETVPDEELAPNEDTEAARQAVVAYPSSVFLQLQRTRRVGVNGRGVAMVTFTVRDDGSLASATISSSSGSRAVDEAAVDHIRRAAPFPEPPPGAQRRFRFEFVSR